MYKHIILKIILSQHQNNEENETDILNEYFLGSLLQH